MSAKELGAMPSQEGNNRLDEPFDIGQFQNIMDIYDSEHFSDSEDGEDDDDDDDDEDEDEDDVDDEEEEEEEEKNMEALYNNLSTYESELDQERFTELEKMLTECDDIIKESDRHLGTLDSFKKTVSLTFDSDSEEEKDAEDLELLQICGSGTPKGGNSPRETNDDMRTKQLFLTEGPTKDFTCDKMIQGGEIVPAISNKISNLTRELQLQLTEADETYERLLGKQTEMHKEMNENSEKLDSERRDNLALLEEEKVQRQHEKEERETAMFHWEEDHQIHVKEELEMQEIYIQRLESLMGREKEAGDYLTRVQQDNQSRRERRSATIIQSIFRMYRTMKEYRILQKKRKEEEERKEEEIKAKQEEERRKVEEEKEKEKRRLKENEERIKREKEEEMRKEEEERRKREEEERKKKMEEERKKREEEERERIEEERKKKEQEEREKREKEEREKKEEEERVKKEEEERKKKEREERKRKEEEEMKREEEERKKREKEEKEKKEKEERKKKEEEKERQKKEEEERMRLEMEEKKKKEEEMKKVEEERKKRETEERMKREEEERKKKVEEERMKREEEERKKKAEEERRIKEEKEREERMKRERLEAGRQRISEEKKEKETKEKTQKTTRNAEEKQMSEVECLQKRANEVKEEDIKMRKGEEDIERNQNAKMDDLSIETKTADDNVRPMNKQKEATCDKTSVDLTRPIKGGGIMNKEREGVWETEKEERIEIIMKQGSEKVEEMREELKTELEILLGRKMDVEDGKNELHEGKRKDPQNKEKMPASPAQQEMNAVTKTGQVEASYLQPLPQNQNVRRLAWMENCIPWGKISNQPWIGDRKDNVERKRPPSNKRLPKPLNEGEILSATKCTSLTQVTSVHLENQSGFTLATLGQCLNLQYLAVNNCQLLTLDGLQSCSQLKYIDVKNNNVEYVNVKGMSSLQVLDLSHNNLGLIHGLAGCSNLLWLNLQHNRITKLGSGLESLRRLHTLLIGHNQLISTSGLQSGGLELQTLDLSHNQLQNVTDIEKFCLLRTLDVSSNNLMETPNFTNHVLMQDLNLSDNCLSSLTELSQCWLPLLRVLNLGQNRLPSVPPIEYIQWLKIIDISNNQLLDFAGIATALSNCKQLEQISLHGNPLSDEQDYRVQMIQTFPSLHYLDSVSSTACVLEKNQATPSSKMQSDNGFQRMCNNQMEHFEKLEHKYHQRLKSIFALEPLDLLGACNAHVKWCQKSLRIAVEFRYAHEYGDTSTGKLPSVDESIEQVQGSAPTLNSTDTTEIVAKVTSPATYHDPSCHTAGKSQDTCPKGQVSEAHLDCSGHDHPVVTASGPETLQEHARTAEAESTKHEYSSLASKTDVTFRGHSESKEKHECAKRPNLQDSNQNGDRLAKRNKAAIHIQAAWRGFNLRTKLHAALEFAQNVYEEESEFGEEIDLESFDMAEADLEKTWTVSDSPSIPMNFPVLGKPPLFRNSSHLNLGLPRSREGNRSTLDDNVSPAPPREAWNTPVVTTRSLVPLNGTPRPKSSEVLQIAKPATPISGNKDSDHTTVILRRKDDEICKEWGFKDARTAQMMLQRAKKMKFNVERREKLKKLDPHQRLALFRKLGEVTPVIPMKSPPMKMLPKKEYFQSRQLGLKMRDFGTISKEEETKIKENRTYQWIHAQIAPSDNSDTRSQLSFAEKNSSRSSKKTFVKTNQRLFLFQKGQVTSAGVRSAGSSEQGRSAMDSENGSSRNSRRRSTPSSQTPPVHLPPIDRSSASPTDQGRWMSHWKPDVNKSDGWGGGKKRNKRKWSHNIPDA